MNAPTSDHLENIQEKWMSALQLHTGIGDQDLGACNLALGMALGELDTAWQRHYDALTISADELAHDNAQLLAKVQAITKGTVSMWRNSDGAHEFGPPIAFDATALLQAAAAQHDLPPHQVDQHAINIAAEMIEEADDGADPLLLAPVDGDEDEELATFRYSWQGLSTDALGAVAGLIDGRPWRIVQPQTKKEIVLAVIRELAAAQHDSEPLTIADFDRSRPEWMPSFPTLSSSLGMTWMQMRHSATSPTSS